MGTQRRDFVQLTELIGQKTGALGRALTLALCSMCACAENGWVARSSLFGGPLQCASAPHVCAVLSQDGGGVAARLCPATTPPLPEQRCAKAPGAPHQAALSAAAAPSPGGMPHPLLPPAAGGVDIFPFVSTYKGKAYDPKAYIMVGALLHCTALGCAALRCAALRCRAAL